MKPDPDNDRIEALGRSVYMDGIEIAAACDEATAQNIAICLAYFGAKSVPYGWQCRLREFFA